LVELDINVCQTAEYMFDMTCSTNLSGFKSVVLIAFLQPIDNQIDNNQHPTR